jgi:hypothetical protein
MVDFIRGKFLENDHFYSLDMQKSHCMHGYDIILLHLTVNRMSRHFLNNMITYSPRDIMYIIKYNKIKY